MKEKNLFDELFLACQSNTSFFGKILETAYNTAKGNTLLKEKATPFDFAADVLLYRFIRDIEEYLLFEKGRGSIEKYFQNFKTSSPSFIMENNAIVSGQIKKGDILFNDGEYPPTPVQDEAIANENLMKSLDNGDILKLMDKIGVKNPKEMLESIKTILATSADLTVDKSVKVSKLAENVVDKPNPNN